MPSAEAVRPSHCPACEVASRPVGEGLSLYGHGLRERQVRGPSEPGATPELRLLHLRRYLCTRCGAVTVVGPMELLTRRLYSAAAIAWALALFSLAQLSPSAVRGLVSPFAHVGATSAAGWLTLLRWCAAARRGQLFRSVPMLPADWSARQVAERVATLVASYAVPCTEPPPLTALVFAGAARAP